MPKAKELDFEGSLLKLQDIVKQLETGEVPLEKAMKLYEQGVKISADCDSMIKNAKLKIEELKPENEQKL